MGARKKTRAILICFTGLDGSGKSTLAKALVKELKGRGVESRYVYGRFAPLLIKPLLVLGRLLLLRGLQQNEDYNQYSAGRNEVLKKRWLGVVYQFLMLFDFWWQMLVKAAIPLKLGKNVVCDRYTYDTVINLAVDLSYSENRMDRMLNRFSKFLPRPELVFVMDVPEEIAFQRKRDIPSMDYLKERRELYLHLQSKSGTIILDSTDDLENLKSIIRDKALEKIAPDGQET